MQGFAIVMTILQIRVKPSPFLSFFLCLFTYSARLPNVDVLNYEHYYCTLLYTSTGVTKPKDAVPVPGRVLCTNPILKKLRRLVKCKGKHNSVLKAFKPYLFV